MNLLWFINESNLVCMIIYLAMNFIILIIMVLFSVAFVTLLERKFLGYIHMRKGPNKVGFMGLFQPFSDAIKLFSKEWFKNWKANFNLYLVSPILILFLMLSNWIIYPYFFGNFDFSLGLLYFMSVTSMGVYVLFGCGWSSNSKFSLLGALRGVAQTISYEVSLALVLLSLVLLTYTYSLSGIIIFQHYSIFGLIFCPFVLIWFLTMLAETNRTPFDLSEGESELVSGFNVEYSSGLFALLFMGEYGMILFMSFMMSILFFGNMVITYFMFMFFVILFVLIRGTLPRMRYDKLMKLSWMIILPVMLNMLLVCIGLGSI